MSDEVQVVIVTAVAALALAVLVWPYVRRSSPPPPCAGCGTRAARSPLNTPQPVRFLGDPKLR